MVLWSKKWIWKAKIKIMRLKINDFGKKKKIVEFKKYRTWKNMGKW